MTLNKMIKNNNDKELSKNNKISDFN